MSTTTPLQVVNKSSYALKITTTLVDITVPAGQTVPIQGPILQIVISNG